MDKLKTIAFYLPQFHPTRLNDELWGAGFSEWTNVTRAKPRFEGHFQPRLPGALGFYDLRSSEVMEEQANWASNFGIDAFCFYYYRFGSERALDRPLDIFLQHPEIDISFLYCWANEPWTRAWDGRTDDIMLAQSYGEEAFAGLLADLIRAMADERYLRVAGRPCFMIYQIDQIPEGQTFIDRLRNDLNTALGEPVTIGCVYSHGFKPAMLEFVDFVVQFPPHRMPRPVGSRILMSAEEVGAFDLERGDNFESYDAVSAMAMSPSNWFSRLFLGVTPDWDNSSRRPTKAHVLIGSTPEKFQAWVADAVCATLNRAASDEIAEPILFINAWNEWAEGANLEPSWDMGDAYLQAFREAIEIGQARFEAETMIDT